VDPFIPDFGLGLNLCEEIHGRLMTDSTSTNYTNGSSNVIEVEKLISNLLNTLAEFVCSTFVPVSAKAASFASICKLINLCIMIGIVDCVPISRFAALANEIRILYEQEKISGKFSVYLQQEVELLLLIEEVIVLKMVNNGSCGSTALTGVSVLPELKNMQWWDDMIRLAVFLRTMSIKKFMATNQGEKKEFTLLNRLTGKHGGRFPLKEISHVHEMLFKRDPIAERLVLIQKLPLTNRIDELKQTLSRLILRVGLEECGELDDETMLSACEQRVRLGIVARVLYLPVDDSGITKGYAVVDVGREDIVKKLITKLNSVALDFEGQEEQSAECENLTELFHCVDGTTYVALCEEVNDTNKEEYSAKTWICEVCTLENELSDDLNALCDACGSNMPQEVVEHFMTLQEVTNTTATTAPTLEASPVFEQSDMSSGGWTCVTCTFFNSWSVNECDICGSERSIDQVPPRSQTRDTETGTQGPTSDDIPKNEQGKADKIEYFVSATSFSDLIEGSVVIFKSDKSRVPSQIESFLRSYLNNPILTSIISHHVTSYRSNQISKLFVDGLTNINPRINTESVEAICTDVLNENPLGLYILVRQFGYDLNLTLSHYLTTEDAAQSLLNWTPQMDQQLVGFCKDLSASIGISNLEDLSLSHFTNSFMPSLREYPSIADLEIRQLRLRYGLLKQLNQLIAKCLPLINLRTWNDPFSMRIRLISLRNVIFPSVKVRFFAQVYDHTSTGDPSQGTSKRASIIIDRRRILSQRQQEYGRISLYDQNTSLFAATRAQLEKIKSFRFRTKRPTGASDPHIAFLVHFQAEDVVGEGGPYRQLFNDIAKELMSSGNDFFIPTPNNVTKSGEYRECLMPKPSNISKQQLQLYEFVGVLMGCCLRTGVHLNLRFAPFIWKMLVQQNISVTDYDTVDWSFCESMKYLESMEHHDNSMMFFDVFTATLSDGSIVELKPNGTQIPVTQSNAKEFIRLVKNARIFECRPQVDALLRGMDRIIPIHLLQLCTWSEIQQWICGSHIINLALLRRHTMYASGMNPAKFPHLEMFWRVLENFSEENKRRFINFAWGQETLPVDDAEFDRTHTRLLIKPPPLEKKTKDGKKIIINQDELLPKAHTCTYSSTEVTMNLAKFTFMIIGFFNLELPLYSSEDILREKLLIAITMCTSMDGDEQAGRIEDDIYYATTEEMIEEDEDNDDDDDDDDEEEEEEEEEEDE
jgi:hypothetical protein